MGMLVLGRDGGQRVAIDVAGVRVWVAVIEASRGHVRLGFSAPPEAVIVREELLGRPRREGATP